MGTGIAPEAGVVVANEPFIGFSEDSRRAVTLAAATVDGGNSPTTQLRRGLVLGYDIGADVWLHASHADVDVSAAAAITAAETADADWASKTFTAALPEIGVSVTVTSGAGDDDDTKIATVLNGDAQFANFFVASVVATRVVITANRTGLLLTVASSLTTAFAAGASNAPVKGKYAVLDDAIASMRDFTGGATAKKRASARTRNFTAKESLLLGITADARQYFRENGIILV